MPDLYSRIMQRRAIVNPHLSAAKNAAVEYSSH